MEKIEFADLVRRFREVVPDADVLIGRCDDELRREIERWPAGETDLYTFLSKVVMYPVVLPALSADDFDADSVYPCFAFIEGLAQNDNSYILGAVYYEVYEQFLDDIVVLERALDCCLPVTRSGLMDMLTEQYPATLAKLRRP
ncbi:hypothetical protein AB0436_13955 [Streptomyces sp. NPDC051322]|uniref:hypothetical protein n=1 Tax=Streptomyces sp. NPDC051322 TaxID=3154645 RepID=UPI00344BBEA7